LGIKKQQCTSLGESERRRKKIEKYVGELKERKEEKKSIVDNEDEYRTKTRPSDREKLSFLWRTNEKTRCFCSRTLRGKSFLIVQHFSYIRNVILFIYFPVNMSSGIFSLKLLVLLLLDR
jgi:hypothetical protein